MRCLAEVMDVIGGMMFFRMYYTMAFANYSRMLRRPIVCNILLLSNFYKADSVLQGNYDYSYFDYSKMKGMSITFRISRMFLPVMPMFYYVHTKKFGDDRYLKGAKSAMDAFVSQKESRFYEVFMPFGALVAAKLNAEHGANL